METIEDILREMRDWERHGYVDCNAHELIVEFADRIEAAVLKLTEENKVLAEYGKKTHEYRASLRCIARSARAALEEEEI